MIRKAALVVAALVVLSGGGLWLWARSGLAGDAVRTAIATRLSQRLGEPVTIGALHASILPRPGFVLEHVTIGGSNRIAVGRLAMDTSLGGLLSRRIEHATVRASDVSVTLPLPLARLTAAASSAPPTPADAASSTGMPVDIVSVDEMQLSNVRLTSNGRTLTGDIDVALNGQRMDVRRIALTAAGTKFTLTGTIADLAGPTGTLTITADELDVPTLLDFAEDFASGMQDDAGSASSASASPGGHAMDVAITVTANRATAGDLAVAHVTGDAHLTGTDLTIDPIRFDVLGGGYTGTLGLTLGGSPQFHIKASIARVKMADVMTFAGHPGLMTGMMSGTLDVSGRGLSAAGVNSSSHGTAQLSIADGTIRGLGLVHGVVVATSGRTGSTRQPLPSSTAERFSRLTASFTVTNGRAATKDLTLVSDDLLLSATGVIRLDGQAVDVAGPLQLSDALSKQAGRDLVKYLQKDARVTVPITITGPADNLSVAIDTGNLAKRAIINAVTDQAKQLLENLGKR